MTSYHATAAAPGWAAHLEIIGPEIFLAYRKRLLQSGISWEIWRDYPSLSLLDVLCRVHAGRRLLRSGGDFAALAAIRSGRWRAPRPVVPPRGAECRTSDQLSRAQVLIGGALFVTLVFLSLLAASGVGDLGARAGVPALVILLGVAGLLLRSRARRVPLARNSHAVPGRCGGRRVGDRLETP